MDGRHAPTMSSGAVLGARLRLTPAALGTWVPLGRGVGTPET